MSLASSLLLAVTIVAHQPGYYTSLAKHVQRWLKDECVGSQVVTPAQMPSALAKERIAFLVGFESVTAAELKTLRGFRARGGKLVVFNSASAALGELMGVKPVGYRVAAYPGEWSRMAFSAKTSAGLPASIRQSSTVLQRARPVAGRATVMASWLDRGGRPTGEPAWLSSSAGFWMTHVLLADGDEDLKARLLGALVGSVDPKAWSLAAHDARKRSRQAAWRALAERQVPRKGEIHAVWDQTGRGLYPGDWPRTIRILKDAHATDLFVNVAGAGFAHYPSAVLPRSSVCEREGDQLAACLAAAKGSGIRVHAWVICFNATRASADRLALFKRKGWRLASAKGGLTDYLSPANPSVRAYVLSAIDELQTRYGVSGVHLDFVRWGDAAVKPKNAAASVTSFVAEARRRVSRPKWLTAAVYGKHPQCVATVGQDWPRWLDLGIVDYVVPMDYTESNAKFAELLDLQTTGNHPRRTIVGIGVTANESRLDVRKVIEQINLTRKRGMAGVSLFDLDTTLERGVLPYLKLGIW